MNIYCAWALGIYVVGLFISAYFYGRWFDDAEGGALEAAAFLWPFSLPIFLLIAAVEVGRRHARRNR